MLLDFYLDKSEIEKTAAGLWKGIGTAAKTLWKNPATRRIGANMATNAAINGAIGFASGGKGRRMKSGLAAAATGAVTGAFSGVQDHMGALNKANGYVGDGSIGGWAKNTWRNIKQTGVDIGNGFKPLSQPTQPPLPF